MSRPSRSVQDIKSTFESRTSATPDRQSPSPPRSQPNTSADMSLPAPKRLNSVPKTPRNSIDAVLDTNPAKAFPGGRPGLSPRPSWIGPKPAVPAITPGGTNMKLPVAVEYESPGLQPPVFICTSLTDPQWEPIEMEATTKDNGEHHFKSCFQAEEGEYQYKLRLGPGDWWVCDESKPTVDDGAGNKNNLLVVKPDVKPAAEARPLSPPPVAQPSVQPAVTSPPTLQVITDPSAQAKPATKDAAAPAATVLTLDSQAVHQATAQDDHIVPDEAPHAPLMPHEVASSDEPHSPLFRHESISRMDVMRSGPASPTSPTSTSQMSPTPSRPAIPQEADVNDPSLIKFPTDRDGIMKHLARAQNDYHEDTPAIAVSPPGSTTISDSPSRPSIREDQQPATLPTVIEFSDAEEDEPKDPAATQGDRPAAPITPPMTPKERESAETNKEVLEVLMAEAVELAAAEAVVEQEARRLAAQRKREAKQANFGALTLAVGFSAAVAALAVGIWLSGRREGMMD